MAPIRTTVTDLDASGLRTVDQCLQSDWPCADLCIGANLLTGKQKTRLTDWFANEWTLQSRSPGAPISARSPPRSQPGRRQRLTMSTIVGSMSKRVRAGLTEVARPGRALNKRADDTLTFFHRPGSSNGPSQRPLADTLGTYGHHCGLPATSPSALPSTARGRRPQASSYTLDWDEPH